VTGVRRRPADRAASRPAHGRTRDGLGGRRFGSSPVRAAAALGLLASILALYGLTTASPFAIRRIEVSPLAWTDETELVRWLGVDTGTNAFLLPTSGLGDRVAELPTVASAEVGVALPDAIVVHVTERTPILAWRVGDVTFLVDRDGMLFALASASKADTAGLPTITDARAISRIVLGVGGHLDPVDLDAATRLASITAADVGSGSASLGVRITDADGFVMTTRPASWAAVFGPYSAILRSPELIPGQVRLLRSLLFGRETQYARITLADETHGTYVPLPTSP
jgi:cell division septal protein FtsQ